MPYVIKNRLFEICSISTTVYKLTNYENNPMRMQGIIKTREKRVQSNYTVPWTHNYTTVIYDASPRYHAP